MNEVAHGVFMTSIQAVNIVDDQHAPPSGVNVFNGCFKVFRERTGIGHPLAGNAACITEFVDRRPANNGLLACGPLAQKRRFPDPRKTGDEGVAVFLNEVGERIEFVLTPDQGDVLDLLGHRLRGRLSVGFGVFLQPCSTAFRDVVHLPPASAAADDVRHTNGDQLAVKQGFERLVEPRTNNAHGIGQTGERHLARNIPRLGQRIGESPEVAQQFFLTSTQHANDRKGSAASFIKHPQRCVCKETGLAF